LKPWRPVGFIGGRASEEEKIGNINSVLFRQRPHLELPRHDSFRGETVHQNHRGLAGLGYDFGLFLLFLGLRYGLGRDPETHHGPGLNLHRVRPDPRHLH